MNDQQTGKFFHPLTSFSLKTLGSCSPRLYFTDQNSAVPCGSHLECSLCLRHFSPQPRCRWSLNFLSPHPWGASPHLGWLPVPPVTPDWPVSPMVALTTPCCQVTASPLDPRLAHGGRFSERAESRVMMSPFLLCYLAIFLEPRKLERVRCV